MKKKMGYLFVGVYLLVNTFSLQSACAASNEKTALLEQRNNSIEYCYSDEFDPLDYEGDCIDENSELLMPVYALQALFISGTKGLANSVGDVVLSLANISTVIVEPQTVCFHPIHSIYSILQPLVKIPTKPFEQLYRMGKRIYLLDCDRFVDHEIDKVSGAALQKNAESERFFNTSSKMNDPINYRLYKAYSAASLLEPEKGFPVRSQKEGKELKFYYQRMQLVSPQSCEIAYKMTGMQYSNLQDLLRAEIHKVHAKASFARLLFSGKSVKQEAKIACLKLLNSMALR